MDASVMEDSALADPSAMMEDLFGDAVDGLDVPLPHAPLPVATILRIGDMHTHGCCTKLAWSNTGSIAYISPDGSKVHFRAIIRDKKTALWNISDESKFPLEAPPGRRFVHIQFSGIGVDLAVADHLGSLHMYTLASAIGRMMPAPGDPLCDGADLNIIVGLHWLALYPTEFRGPYVEPAIKVGEKWEFPLKYRDQIAMVAHQPADQKGALISVSREGEISLLFQNQSQSWLSTSVPLDRLPQSNGDLISHADIAEDGADLFVVTCDHSSRFRLYRVSINWNATQHNRGPNMNYTLVTPTLEVQRLTALDNVRAQHADAAKLTLLRIIPTVPIAQAVRTPPTVVAVFTHASLPTEPTQGQGSFSVVARWYIEQCSSTLHESLFKLKATVLLDPVVTRLRRQPDVIMNKVILAFESQTFDTIFAFAASDGTVEFRERANMEEVHAFGDSNMVSSLAQSGFDHIPGDHNTHVAMTADGSALALVRPDGKVSAHPMTSSHGWQVLENGNINNEPMIEAAAVCVAREYAFLCYNNVSTDETLALLPFDTNPEVKSKVTRNVFRLLVRTLDISMLELKQQQQILFREVLVPRSLSVVLALGTHSASGERSAAAQTAFCMLNLRLITIAFLSTISRPDARNIPVEMYTSLCGLVKWVTDLFIYIVDTVVNLKRNLEAGSSAKHACEQLIATHNSPVIHLLLCSFTRAQLRFIINYIGRYLSMVQGAVYPRARTVTERQQLKGVLELAAHAPFRYPEFEKMVIEFDQAIRRAWQSNGTPLERRGELEIAMMCDSEVPAELEPALDALVDSIVPKMMESVDVSKLYLWNTAWLGLSNSWSPPGRRPLDVIRKIRIPDGMPLRHCRRCGSLMEDLPPEKIPELPSWLATAQKHCVCLNYWFLV